MKIRFLCFSMAVLLAVSCGAVPAFGQTSGNGIVALAVSTSDVPVVTDQRTQYIVIRENSESPTNAFMVKLTGTSTYVRVPAGGQFQFSSSTQYPFASGATVAVIKLVSGGPATFSVIESSSAPALVSKSVVPAGTGGAVNSVNTRIGDVVIVAGDIPNNNANTTGTASNLSGTPALPNGTTASTQTQADNSTKLATTQYVDTLGGAKVPTTRTVNGHALSADVTVNASELGVGALPSGTAATTPSQADNSTKVATTAYVDALGTTKVATTRQVAGHALSSDVTINAADLAVGNLSNGVAATTQAQADNSTKLATTAYVDALGTTKANTPTDGCSADFSICKSAVDASGNPAFIAQGSAGNNLTITGTGLVLTIDGARQTGTGTYTDAITGLTSSTFNYVYAKKDTSNANLVGADFARTSLAPVYSYTSPTACTGASSTNPQYWFDLSARQWKVSTAAACSMSVASPQVVFLGVLWVTAAPAISGVAHEPFNLDPYHRFRTFGDGFDGPNAGTDITKQEKTTGSTTIDNFHTYASFELTGATVVPTQANNNGSSSGTLVVLSQNPVLIVNTSSVTATGKAKAGGNGQTGVGSSGQSGGFGGAAAGGGGGSSSAGGAGGGRDLWVTFGNTAGSPAGGATNTVGASSTGTPTGQMPFCHSLFAFGLQGASGGGGGGDGTHAGGAGGAGGGGLFIRAPSIILDSGSSIVANGSNGSNASVANAGGGGPGGGGVVIVCGGFNALAGTVTAIAGTAGTGAGTGGAGGTSSDGIVQKVKIL